ncbi:MAG: DUF362 domain-containing protein [Spirochaetia bacterium]|nr:MAG: DUF362 domain-containing protein [Spirochaetia bacterium]
MNKVGKINLKNGINLKDAVLKVVDEIGGFKKFIKTGDVVFLKPNYNTADPSPASTSVDFLKVAVELSYDFGAKLVMIGESSTMTLNTKKILGKAGVFELLEMKTPPRIYTFEEGAWVKKEIPGAKYLKKVSIPEILERADKLILLPCLKTHKYAQFTGALKLSVGFAKPNQRVFLHLNLQEKIAELNKIIHPDLIIMDARKCFISGGPSKGVIREPNLILASEDRVAIDIEGIKIIQNFEGNSLAGINPEDLPQIANSKH